MDPVEACDLARERIQADMDAAVVRIVERDASAPDNLKPVRYDNQGAPIYRWQETP